MTGAETPDETTAVVGGCPADGAVETIQREMTVFARRARASAGRMHPELSLVSYTLLGHLEERDGRRATDLAAHYALDKSTVSRQVSALERAGLIERRVDPDDHRVQVLHLTESGRQALDRVTERRRTAFRERLADWAEEDLLRFAGYLERYNAWPGEAPAGERDQAAPGPRTVDGTH
ncbi:MarR family winged helix-turn-helix transcriptional regulator [Streptomyces sp. IBSBF 2507]|uniref:MarR family winged helix-turn-helix transcriptional regulator n=1 Tax=Streptomyces sp. IBSBF 2507 TaxID=2903530 RepID=UPI00351DB2ED